jgi:hypothetical protein
MYYQYQSIELARDLNHVLKEGMLGVILEVWDEQTFEVEFLNEEGYNYEYNGEGIFTLTAKDIRPRKQN